MRVLYITCRLAPHFKELMLRTLVKTFNVQRSSACTLLVGRPYYPLFLCLSYFGMSLLCHFLCHACFFFGKKHGSRFRLFKTGNFWVFFTSNMASQSRNTHTGDIKIFSTKFGMSFPFTDFFLSILLADHQLASYHWKYTCLSFSWAS